MDVQRERERDARCGRGRRVGRRAQLGMGSVCTV